MSARPFRSIVRGALAGALALAASAASAELRVGVTLSLTGPAASLGLPAKNTLALLPHTLGGQAVRYIVLDDRTDPTQAVTNTRKLITEDHVDVILGSTTSPNSLAMVDVVAEAQVPMISVAASSRIVEPMDARRRWVFKTPLDDRQWVLAIASHMKDHGVKTVGFIGFSDAYGEGLHTEFEHIAPALGLKLVADERYARSDASVTGQVLRLQAAHPDAVLVAASGTPAALPEITLKQRGYAGLVYQTAGAANGDFLRVGGRDVEGTYLPVAPVVVARQLPAGHPVRASALDYYDRYEAAYGPGSVTLFGACAWDAGRLLSVAVPVALKKAAPGTPAFRAALRDALEGEKNIAGAEGIYNMTPGDHAGLDQRGRVMVRIEHGTWKLQE